MGHFTWGAILQEQAVPVWIPHRVTSPASKPAPAWAPLSTGPHVLPRACSNAGSPQGYNLLHTSTCSGVRPFHRVQSFGNRLLQRESPMGSQVLPGNLLRHGLLSLHGATGACSSMGFPRDHSLLQAHTGSSMGSFTSCRLSAPLRSSMGYKGTACITMVFMTGCSGKTLCSGVSSTSSPSFFTDLGVCIVSHLSLDGCIIAGFSPSEMCYR